MPQCLKGSLHFTRRESGNSRPLCYNFSLFHQ